MTGWLARAAAAGRLRGQLGYELLRAARQAFTQGLRVVFAISAAVVAGAAVLAAIQLRRLPPGAAPGGAHPGRTRRADTPAQDPTKR